jgi:hypothetical protein
VFVLHINVVNIISHTRTNFSATDDWKEFDHGLDPSIRAWEKLSPQSPIPYIKIEGTLPASPLVCNKLYLRYTKIQLRPHATKSDLSISKFGLALGIRN